MRKIFSLVVLFLLSSVLTGKAQELRCNVQLVTQQIQGSNKQIFRTFQTAIYEFMNNRNWTQDVFDASEKIECNILINLTEQIGGDQFRGTIQVQSRRPVYNSTYSTTVLNFMDNNFDVRYVENETLEFDDNQHLSNLTSILAYYAYTIIGLDYDTFSPEGGTFYLKKAETIVMNAQNAPEAGWKAFGSAVGGVDKPGDLFYVHAEEVLREIEKSAPLVSFIHVTGGEPTLQEALLAQLREIEGLEKASGPQQRPHELAVP